jgi:hypothetical protein
MRGKIKRWHQTPKDRTLFETYYPPGQLEPQIVAFVDHDNHRRPRKSLSTLALADVYFGRGAVVLQEREHIKRKTLR